MSTTAINAYRSIREMMTNGEFSQGQRISQVKLARKLGCSTVPVVEAMRLLESEGLLVNEPRKMAKIRKLTPGEIEDLYTLRELIEPYVTRLCASRISDEQIQELKQLHQKYLHSVSNKDFDKSRLFDFEIHHFIAKCADCSLISEELERLSLVEKTAGKGDFSVPPYVHNALIQAIEDHDIDSAEYFMKKHIRTGRMLLISQNSLIEE